MLELALAGPSLRTILGRAEDRAFAGDFENAQHNFQGAAAVAADAPSRAEAHYHACHAALERRDWPTALGDLLEAALHDPDRFAPFPMDKYEPERILGAGGFGIVFLCRDRHTCGHVVVKSLRHEGLGRALTDVFSEARLLDALEHPGIVRLRHCAYADAAGTRPYLVMEYFEGATLADLVRLGTPQPGRKHWQSAPEQFANLLSDCQSEQPRDRPADFTAVLRDLNALAPAAPSSLPQTAWETACRQDTAESYEGYLSTFPGGAHAEEARRRAATELRGRLRNDWSNKQLRARYLAVRTPAWRHRDGKPWEEWHGRAAALSAQAGAVLGTLLGFWLGIHAGTGLVGMLALTALGPLRGAVVVVGGWMCYIRASERRLGSFEALKRVGDELGPVPLDTPRDLATARRRLLG